MDYKMLTNKNLQDNTGLKSPLFIHQLVGWQNNLIKKQDWADSNDDKIRP